MVVRSMDSQSPGPKECCMLEQDQDATISAGVPVFCGSKSGYVGGKETSGILIGILRFWGLYIWGPYILLSSLIYFYQEKKKKKIRKSCRTVLCNARSQVSILQLDLKQLRHTTVLLLQLCPVTAKDPYFSAPRGLDPKGTVPIHNCSVSLQVLSACPELHL